MFDDIGRLSNGPLSPNSKLPRTGGIARFGPSKSRPRTQPNAKSTLDARLSQLQHNIMRIFDSLGTGAGSAEARRYASRLADAEAFLKQLKGAGVIDESSGSRFAAMPAEIKKDLLTLNLPRHSSKPHERINARRAIVAYADRHGFQAAMDFKDGLLQPRRHWIKGRIVKMRPFKLLGTTCDHTGPELKAFEPGNLERMCAYAVLGEGLKSAAENHPTLENVAPHLSLDDLSALNEQHHLFSKNGPSTPIGELLHVPADGVSSSEDQQKIRDLMLLATAKEAAAAKADENRDMDLESLKGLKTDLLEAAQGGKKELAERYNEEMAKHALQPGAPDADPMFREINKTSADAETYRTSFQDSVKQWSKDNKSQFIGLPELTGVSRAAIARIVNKRKLDAHEKKVAGNEVALVQDFKPAAKGAYLKELKLLAEKENQKGHVLNEQEFEKMSKLAHHQINFQQKLMDFGQASGKI